MVILSTVFKFIILVSIDNIIPDNLQLLGIVHNKAILNCQY